MQFSLLAQQAMVAEASLKAQPSEVDIAEQLLADQSEAARIDAEEAARVKAEDATKALAAEQAQIAELLNRQKLSEQIAVAEKEPRVVERSGVGGQLAYRLRWRKAGISADFSDRLGGGIFPGVDPHVLADRVMVGRDGGDLKLVHARFWQRYLYRWRRGRSR